MWKFMRSRTQAGAFVVILLAGFGGAAAGFPGPADPIAQVAELTPSNPVHLDFFGASVAISGNTAVVGIGYNGFQKGEAYIFEKPTSGWANMTQTARLTASDGTGGDRLGFSVAISGDTVVVGAVNANATRGAAYVFVKPAGGWVNMTETAKLSASDAALSSSLGNSVGVSGNTVVAGSGINVNGTSASFLFVKPATGWANITETAELTSSDSELYDQLGFSVAVSGNTVVAGAPGWGRGGKVYVYVEPASGWVNTTETCSLTASGGTGESVAISGNTVVTGSSGAAFVFVKPPTGWVDMTDTAELTAADGAVGDEFGYSVSIDGARVAIGAPFAAIVPNLAQGAAYLFSKPSSGWVSTSHPNKKLTALDGAKSDNLGWSVSASGNAVLVGSPGHSATFGSAYIFEQ